MDIKYEVETVAAQEKIEQVIASLKKQKNDTDIITVMVESILKRFATNGLNRYTDYGLYWWALKDVLKKHGHEFGDETDEGIKQFYIGNSDIETLVKADMFRDYLLENFALYKRDYNLSDKNPTDVYMLNDEDMESLANLSN